MYATVRQLKYEESFKDEAKRLTQRELLPRLREIPGFIDYYLIFTEKGAGFSIGVFTDKKGCQTMNTLAGDFVKEWTQNKVHVEKMTEGEIVLTTRTPAAV